MDTMKVCNHLYLNTVCVIHIVYGYLPQIDILKGYYEFNQEYSYRARGSFKKIKKTKNILK